jgi:hypothetical protein
MVLIQLIKPQGVSVGVKLVASANGVQGVLIDEVDPEGMLGGRVAKGDLLVSICGEPCTNGAKEAAEKLRSATGNLRLEVTPKRKSSRLSTLASWSTWAKPRTHIRGLPFELRELQDSTKADDPILVQRLEWNEIYVSGHPRLKAHQEAKSNAVLRPEHCSEAGVQYVITPSKQGVPIRVHEEPHRSSTVLRTLEPGTQVMCYDEVHDPRRSPRSERWRGFVRIRDPVFNGWIPLLDPRGDHRLVRMVTRASAKVLMAESSMASRLAKMVFDMKRKKRGFERRRSIDVSKLRQIEDSHHDSTNPTPPKQVEVVAGGSAPRLRLQEGVSSTPTGSTSSDPPRTNRLVRFGRKADAAKQCGGAPLDMSSYTHTASIASTAAPSATASFPLHRALSTSSPDALSTFQTTCLAPTSATILVSAPGAPGRPAPTTPSSESTPAASSSSSFAAVTHDKDDEASTVTEQSSNKARRRRSRKRASEESVITYEERLKTRTVTVEGIDSSGTKTSATELTQGAAQNTPAQAEFDGELYLLGGYSPSIKTLQQQVEAKQSGRRAQPLGDVGGTEDRHRSQGPMVGRRKQSGRRAQPLGDVGGTEDRHRPQDPMDRLVNESAEEAEGRANLQITLRVGAKGFGFTLESAESGRGAVLVAFLDSDSPNGSVLMRGDEIVKVGGVLVACNYFQAMAQLKRFKSDGQVTCELHRDPNNRLSRSDRGEERADEPVAVGIGSEALESEDASCSSESSASLHPVSPSATGQSLDSIKTGASVTTVLPPDGGELALLVPFGLTSPPATWASQKRCMDNDELDASDEESLFVSSPRDAPNESPAPEGNAIVRHHADWASSAALTAGNEMPAERSFFDAVVGDATKNIEAVFSSASQGLPSSSRSKSWI